MNEFGIVMARVDELEQAAIGVEARDHRATADLLARIQHYARRAPVPHGDTVNLATALDHDARLERPLFIGPRR